MVLKLKRNALPLLLFGLLALAACGRSASSGANITPGQPTPGKVRPETTAATPPPTAGLPAFPGNRRPSNLISDSAMAGDCDQAGPGITMLGDAALLVPGSSQAASLEYATDTSGGVPPTASFLFEGSRTTGAWIAIADYTTQRWEFHGPYAATDEVRIDLTGGDNYASPSNNLWVAVIAPPGGQALFRVMTFGAVDPSNQLPVPSFTIQVDSATAPQNILVFGSASSDPDGHILEWDWDWDGDGVYDRFDNGGNDSHLYPGLGTAVTLRVVDDQLATATLTLPVVFNQSPTAQLVPALSKVPASAVVALDASGSSDTDGSIAHFAWDLDNNGLYGEAGLEASFADQAQINFQVQDVGGPQTVGVQVTDNGGATATTSVDLTITGWSKQVIQASAGPLNPSLAMVGGYPATVYQDPTAGETRFAIAQTGDGLGSWSVYTADASGDELVMPQLAEINGKPAFSSADTTHGVCFRYSDQPDGSSGWHRVDIVNNGGKGVTSLAQTTAGLGLSYYDASGEHAAYAYTAVADGSSGWTTVDVDTSGHDTGEHNALAIVSGRPAMAYGDETTKGVHYAYSSQADGSSGWTTIEVAASGSGSPSVGNIMLAGGCPAFAWEDDGNVEWARSLMPDGTSGWGSLRPDATAVAEYAPSLTITGGLPVLLFTAGTDSPLECMRSTLDDGSSGWSRTQAEPGVTSSDCITNFGRVTIVYTTPVDGAGLVFSQLYE